MKKKLDFNILQFLTNKKIKIKKKIFKRKKIRFFKKFNFKKKKIKSIRIWNWDFYSYNF